MRKIYGVGINDMRGKWCCGGKSNYNEYEFRVYRLWTNMLSRSYKLGLSTVCDRWKLFSNFIKDVPYIQGYRLFLSNIGSHSICLDKDIKYFGNKVYDPSTVQFVTITESTKDARARTKPRKVKATNLNNPLDIKYYDYALLAEQDGFSNQRISECCRGKRVSHKGYQWEYV